MSFFPETRQERQRRQLEQRFDRWYAKPQPIRFYLWLFWLHLVPIYWLYFRISGWMLRRRVKGFETFTMPLIESTDLRCPLYDLVSVQPLKAPVSQIFYLDYQMGSRPPEPRTRRSSGWLWGIVVWRTI